MGIGRRGFLGFLGLAGVAAPTVKQTFTLPDTPVDMRYRSYRYRGPFDPPIPGVPDHSNYYDVQDGVLYDRVRFEPGATLPIAIEYFLNPVGSPCPYSGVRWKTYKHTNMHMHGQLPAPTEFLARSIMFAAHPSVAEADLQAISAEGEWEFRLMNKIMSRGPMLLNGPARASLRDVVIPQPDPYKHAKLNPNIPAEVIDTARHNRIIGGTHILCQMTFGVSLRFSTQPVKLLPAKDGGRGIDLLVGFEGLDARGVQ